MSNFRSKFEAKFASDLDQRKIKFTYEPVKIKYRQDIFGGICKNCGSKAAYKNRTYTPDFYLKRKDLYIETKGRLTSDNRKKHIAIRADNPELDIRFIFMSDNKISSSSETRYSDWCKANGFLYAFKTLPKEWIR